MREFKFLKRNTHYEEQITVGVCGSTLNYITAFRADNTILTGGVINNEGIITDRLLSELVNATRNLREEMNVLEEQTRRLRDDLNRSLGEL